MESEDGECEGGECENGERGMESVRGGELRDGEVRGGECEESEDRERSRVKQEELVLSPVNWPQCS